MSDVAAVAETPTTTARPPLDATDRRLINELQSGFPLHPRPFELLAERLALGEAELIARIDALQANGYITRFGPLFDIEKMGGAYTLAAMAVPPERWDAVVAQVNAMPEIAHNYAREHRLNMWFVIAVECCDDTDPVVQRIEQQTGLPVLALPKLTEYFIGLRLQA
jgi:siroheme decarboxylase